MDFCPVESFICSEPNNHNKIKIKTTGKKKEHIHVFTDST